MPKKKIYIEIDATHPSFLYPELLEIFEEAILELASQEEDSSYILDLKYEGPCGQLLRKREPIRHSPISYFPNEAMFKQYEELSSRGIQPSLDSIHGAYNCRHAPHGYTKFGTKEILSSLEPIVDYISELRFNLGFLMYFNPCHPVRYTAFFNAFFSLLAKSHIEAPTIVASTTQLGGSALEAIRRELPSNYPLKNLHIIPNVAYGKSNSLETWLIFCKHFQSLKVLEIGPGSTNYVEMAHKKIEINGYPGIVYTSLESMRLLIDMVENNGFQLSIKGFSLNLEGKHRINKFQVPYTLNNPNEKTEVQTERALNNVEQVNNLYSSLLKKFLNSLVDSDLCISLPSNDSFWLRSKSDLEDALLQVIKTSSCRFMGYDVRVIGGKCREFKEVPSGPELKRAIEEKVKLDMRLESIMELFKSGDYVIAPDEENVGFILISYAEGKVFRLGPGLVGMLLEYTLVRGSDYEEAHEKLEEVLVESFWQRNGVFKGDNTGGAYFGDIYLAKELLDYIASFLPQYKLVSEYPARTAEELFFTEDQMNAVGHNIQGQAPGVMHYLGAVDGRIPDEDSDYHIANVIARHIEEYGSDTPFALPILVNPTEEHLGIVDNAIYANHWILYFHQGRGQGYLIDPLAGFSRNTEHIENIIFHIARNVYEEQDLPEIFNGFHLLGTDLQTDSYNCGVWVLYLMQRLQAGIELDTEARQVIEEIRQENPDIGELRHNYETLARHIQEPEPEELTETAPSNHTEELEPNNPLYEDLENNLPYHTNFS